MLKKYEPEIDGDKELFYKNFLDEIKIMYKLNHRNIVRIYNYYAYGDIYTGYILMEYIDGKNIGTFIADYIEPLEKVTLDEVFVQLIDGFQYIEEHGIIHRDIREGNILIDKAGTVKIIDFGIGKTYDKAGNNQDSLHSQINRANSDTLPQEYSEGIYTSKTDQFYLAELLNRLIGEAEDVDETDFSYHSILAKMMQKKADNRYSSFVEVRDAIGKLDFSNIVISEEDKNIYQSFANKLTQSISTFKDERKFNYNTQVFVAKLEKAIADNLFEDFIQKNEDVISAIVISPYRYDNSVGINCSVVRNFLNWFKKSTIPSQQLILNNIISKLSIIHVIVDDPDLPF